MASVSMVRGTKTEIESTPRVDGQVLFETDQGDLNKIYIDTDNDGTIERTMAGGGGHLILPDPAPDDPADEPTEDLVVQAVNSVQNDTDRIGSLYGMQQWSNEKTKRYIVVGDDTEDSPIGSTGIGTWVDEGEVIEATPIGTENPSSEGWYEIDTTTGSPTIHQYILSTDTSVVANKKYFTEVIDESDWLYLDILTTITSTNPVSGMTTNDISLGLKFDPSSNEVIVLGGYMIDTDTGNICVKFANSISDVANAKVAIDITYTRTDTTIISN